MSKQDSLRTQTYILKVNIDCNGCARKVKKRLQKIQGVNSVSVDAEQGKVVVTGDKVDPAKLIKKLSTSGMHAELLLNGLQQKPMNLTNQFQTKGEKEKDNKSNKGNQKNHKSVSFKLHEQEFDASDDHGHDLLKDYSDSDSDDEEEKRYGHGHPMPMMRNAAGINAHVIDPTMIIKGKTGNINHNNAKKANKLEKQNNEDQIAANENNRVKYQYMVGIESERDGIKKNNTKSNGGGFVARFLRFGKKNNKKGNQGAPIDNYNNKNNNFNEIKEEKEVDKKLEDGGISKSKNTKGSHMGQMGPMDIRAVQMQQMQPPSYEQMQPPSYEQMQPPSYNHQQYMAMMNQHQQQQHQQQQAYMNNMGPPPPPMMYGRQQPYMNYMPPPPPIPLHPINDPITHNFSDENVQSCTIM